MTPQAITAGLSGQGLTMVQRAVLAAYGVALWALAALAIRGLTPHGVFGAQGNVVTYALSVPVCWLLARSAVRVARLAPGQALGGVAFISAVGLLGDSIAVAWFPGIYGGDPAMILYGLGWLFWGVGWCLVGAIPREV